MLVLRQRADDNLGFYLHVLMVQWLFQSPHKPVMQYQSSVSEENPPQICYFMSSFQQIAGEKIDEMIVEIA